MSKLKLYFDTLSQPSRCLLIFLQKTGLPFEQKPVRLGKGEHLTPEYLKINPFHQVPVIDDNGFILRESVGIVRYLAREKGLNEHWYPNESKAQAKHDEYLEWQHLGLRLHCGFYFRTLWLEPLMTNRAPEEAFVERLKRNMIAACDSFEKDWLKQGSPFLFGDKISAADLFAATELEQPRMCGFDPRDGRPKLEAWIARVQEESNPYYDEAHSILNKIVEKFKGKSPALVGN